MFAPKLEEQPTMRCEKWENCTQEFLATTKMINMSLVKVSCNELTNIGNLFAVEDDDCVSIEDELEEESKENLTFNAFQNPTCFFTSQFNLGGFQ